MGLHVALGQWSHRRGDLQESARNLGNSLKRPPPSVDHTSTVPAETSGVLSRRIEVDGKFFALDGGRFTFRGVTYGSFAPRADGMRFPARDRIKSDFASMCEAGFNVVRTYDEPSDDLLEAGSDWGIRVLAGVHWNDWRYLLGGSRRQQRAVARSAVLDVHTAARRLAGNEDLVALCVGNEIPADVVRWVGTRRVADLVRELADTVRQQDPDRLVTYANYPTTEYLPLEHLDFLTFNVFLERRADLRRYLTRLHHLAGDRPVVLGELGLHAENGRAGELAQAASLDWQVETALERGVAGTCIFSWTDEWHVGDGPVEGWRFGLTRADRSPREALAVATKWNRRSVADLLPVQERPSISVVVCAYNAAETLDECLRHTCALDYRPLEVIVVDDGSSDDTASIAARHEGVRLLRIAHAGLSAARNEGFRAARSDLVAYLDADAYPSPEWPYYLALGLDSRFVGGVGGPNISPSSDPLGAKRVERASGGPVHVLLADDRAEHIPGCNMAFWRDVLIELDGFEPVYTAAGDDVDFCWRVLNRGWEIGFHPAALVWHHRRSTTRAYLRQQRGYGRAEALVAARHPDRFTGLGSARWRGRMYGSGIRTVGGSRIYRGAYGAAAYQSVYGNGGTALDLAHQLGIPVAALLLLTLPLAVLTPVLFAPAAVAIAFFLTLAGVDAVRALPPTRLVRHRRPAFRVAVAALDIVQPLARAWGRMRHETTALRGLPLPSALLGPVRHTRGVIVLPGDRPREQIAAAVVDAVRRRGIAVRPSTGWEDHDANLLGCLFIAGDIVTVDAPAGLVQVRIRRRLRPAVAAVVALGAVTAAVSWPFAVAMAAVVAAEGLRGMWRTGPAVRRAIGAATQGAVSDGPRAPDPQDLEGPHTLVDVPVTQS